MVKVIPPEGYLSKAVRKHFDDLKNAPNRDPKFKSALEFARRCHEKYEDGTLEEPAKKRFRSEGAGRKVVAPEFRDQIFEWFIGKIIFFGTFIR